jgi:hypothetical protein
VIRGTEPEPAEASIEVTSATSGFRVLLSGYTVVPDGGIDCRHSSGTLVVETATEGRPDPDGYRLLVTGYQRPQRRLRRYRIDQDGMGMVPLTPSLEVCCGAGHLVDRAQCVSDILAVTGRLLRRPKSPALAA